MVKFSAFQVPLDTDGSATAETSDLFDLLPYVAFASAPETRIQRAAKATAEVRMEFTDRQHAFVDFVLAQYVNQGVSELGTEKPSPLLKLRYKCAIADAVKDLESPEQISQVPVGFQRYLTPRRSALRGSSTLLFQ